MPHLSFLRLITLAVGLLAGAGFLCPASGEHPLSVVAVRYWSLGDVTRIAVETTGDFRYVSDHIPDPERYYFDILGARSRVGPHGLRTIPVGDRLIKQIRVAQTQLKVTRIVLDVQVPVEVTVSQLASPDRLIIEVRPKGPALPPASGPSVVGGQKFPEPEAPPEIAPPAASVLPPVVKPPDAPPISKASPPKPAEPVKSAPKVSEARPERVTAKPPPKRPEKAERPAPPPEKVQSKVQSSERASSAEDEIPQAAARNSNGDRSMTRVLGLKIGRIVIDPGHGGHDTGTMGRNGLLEKDLVLDVAKRLRKLIEEQMGSEVILTRSDDTFIPLEQRTAIANQAKADLFLSIHANSSPYRNTTGVETFYLNFTTSKADLDVAARENASSQKTVYELKDLLQKIALQDKVEESKEFAARVQSALYAASSRGSLKSRDRGVKKAPFVVLIGAQMPSILSEIGFISNPREEALMKKPEQRQRIAEALYQGLSRYAATLSHFQMASDQRQ